MDKTPEQMLVELLHRLLDTSHMDKSFVDVSAINRHVTNSIHFVSGLTEWWYSVQGQEETQRRILTQCALDKLTRDEAHALGFGCDWDARQAFKEAMTI
jgi:hypothetical protein